MRDCLSSLLKINVISAKLDFLYLVLEQSAKVPLDGEFLHADANKKRSYTKNMLAIH